MATFDAKPSSRVELSISCRNLVDLDLLSKSDPLVVVYEQIGAGWQEVGRTEMIKNNLNPDFKKTFIVNYRFEEVQNFRFVVYDIDDFNNTNLASQELIGETTCQLAEIICSRGQTLHRPLLLNQQIMASNRSRRASSIKMNQPRNGLPGASVPNRGIIQIHSEELSDANNQMLTIRFRGKNLEKKSFLFGSTDPFLRFHRVREDNSTLPVADTEKVSGNLNPTWRPIQISSQQLCNGDPQRPIVITCYDHKSSGNHKEIGEIRTTMAELMNSKGRTFQLTNSKTRKASGQIIVEDVSVQKLHTFIDYLKGGQEINLMIAIDFTASNGNPQQPGTLHYISESQSNEYIQAILAIGDILSHYDSDKRFPVYGFGAKLPPNYAVSHCFPCNFNWQQPEVVGISGVVAAYQSAIRTVVLHGPTIFSQIINTAATFATESPNKYVVLLIITDGVISDMDNTITEIVRASGLPLSIIIVGVGGADFTNMNILDADDAPLVSNGRRMERDIVQFVPFRQFKNNPALLAKETLYEVPDQFLSYMRKMKIEPRPPLSAQPTDFGPAQASYSGSGTQPLQPQLVINNPYAQQSEPQQSQPQQPPPQQQPPHQPQHQPPPHGAYYGGPPTQYGHGPALASIGMATAYAAGATAPQQVANQNPYQPYYLPQQQQQQQPPQQYYQQPPYGGQQQQQQQQQPPYGGQQQPPPPYGQRY